MSAPSEEEAWAPEPELREPTPRRLRPSDYPDLNVPNVKLYFAIGGLALAAGLALLVLGIVRKAPAFSLPGGVSLLLGGAALWYAPSRAATQRARAERLVRDGMPLMARIVSSQNLTGDSVHGRTVSYMMTLPGGEVIRRDVNADERALPRRIPANVTALVDPKNTNDAELYCVLPFRAEARPQPAQSAPITPAVPQSATMRTIDMPAPPPQAPAQPATAPAAEQPPQEQKSPSGYQGLPWE